MSTTTRGPARVAALGLVGALSAAGLAVVAAAPAGAAPVAPVLAWEISPRFDDHLSTHVLGDGATESADGVITFPDGVGTFDAATGAATVSYQGSVAGSFVNAGTTYYTVTVADPTVTVAADGSGQISAVVSASNAATGPSSPAASTTPARVVMTTFAAPQDWTVADGLGSITATPAWAGVLPAGSAEAVALGLPAGQPVDGKSFAPTFLGQLTPGVRAHFYASGATSDAAKQVSSFTAQASPAAPPAATVASSYGNGAVTLGVTGTGFTPSDGNPGDDGVYVGLAPAGGLPDVDSQDDMGAFVASAWVRGAAIVDGRLSASLVVRAESLNRATSYAVYTWRAHGHSSTSQDSQTPVTIDWARLSPVVAPVPAPAQQTSVAATWTRKPTTARAGRLRLVVSSATGTPTGQVRVLLAKSGRKVRVPAATLAGGSVTVPVKKLARGTWRATASYLGADGFSASASTVTVKVAKATKKRNG